MTTLEEPGNCTRCGTHAQYRNTAGECSDCHNLRYHEYRAARKAELAALPRCDLCNRRGSWKAAGALLCGFHLQKARKEWARRAPGFLGFLGANLTREDMLEMAR